GEVERAHRDGAGLDALVLPEDLDVFLVAVERATRQVIGDARLARELLVTGIGVDQLERVLAVAVLEVVVDAFFFHEAAHEIEVGLPILHAVFPLGILPGEAIVEHRHRMVGEDLLDDVGDRLFLENLAIGRARQKPEPRAHGHPIFVVAAERFALGKAGDVAVEVAVATLHELELHRDGLAEQLARLDITLGRQRRQLELGGSPELLAPAQRAEEQVLPQLGSELDHARHHGTHARSKEKSPLRTPRVMAPRGRPATMRARYSSLIRGKIVLVRIASIMRPPLSTSVQRETTSFTTASSYVNGTLCCSAMRRAIRPNCRRTMSPRIVSGSG